MRLCRVKDLEDGMILGKSICQLNGKLLLREGVRLDQAMKKKLEERGYTHVYIMEEGTEDVVPDDIVSDEVSFEAKNKLASKIYDIQNQIEFKNASVAKATDLIEKGYLKKTRITYDMRNIVGEILKDISSAGARLLNSVMIKTADTFFLDHALNVAVLSILIGRKYRFSQKELMSLGLGAFLHDIGKIVIEQMSESDDSMKSRNLYKEHPTFGYLMLSNSPNVSPLETQIVNQHHEYQDGTGFPSGLKGENLPPVKTIQQATKNRIFRMAEIVTVADAFDNLTYNPLSREENDPVGAIRQIILGAGKKYNREIVRTLLQVVPYYPVGATIEVVDLVDPRLVGYVGVVAKLHDDNINKPIIILTKDRYKKKIKPIVVDTAKLKKINLRLVV